MRTTLTPRAVMAVALATGLLLLVPLLAMQFTSEMSWGGGDFAAAAVLLFVTGLALVAGTRLARTRGRRIAAAALIVAIFLTIWAELAVGLFH